MLGASAVGCGCLLRVRLPSLLPSLGGCQLPSVLSGSGCPSVRTLFCQQSQVSVLSRCQQVIRLFCHQKGQAERAVPQLGRMLSPHEQQRNHARSRHPTGQCPSQAGPSQPGYQGNPPRSRGGKRHCGPQVRPSAALSSRPLSARDVAAPAIGDIGLLLLVGSQQRSVSPHDILACEQGVGSGQYRDLWRRLWYRGGCRIGCDKVFWVAVWYHGVGPSMPRVLKSGGVTPPPGCLLTYYTMIASRLGCRPLLSPARRC